MYTIPITKERKILNPHARMLYTKEPISKRQYSNTRKSTYQASESKYATRTPVQKTSYWTNMLALIQNPASSTVNDVASRQNREPICRQLVFYSRACTPMFEDGMLLVFSVHAFRLMCLRTRIRLSLYIIIAKYATRRWNITYWLNLMIIDYRMITDTM